ncbi:MAG: acyl-CoA dehydrogenase [Pseudomonadota bacterium]|jgi:alkylation response protein AidB-like acyl-CoA dehydrogenase|nr:acyl-CoA dehydrogenase [Pseudomonadota bacterium]QKK04170.1 MAG: acyl-CoA dehydrogenase [Pseudomonadota bacterium]
MTEYRPPLEDLAFVLDHIAGFDGICGEGSDINMDLARAVLEEAGKLAADVWAPLNSAGDKQPAVMENGVLKATPGFKEAYLQFAEGGWNAISFDEAFGGQDMPWCLAMAAAEMWQASNLSLSLCPLLGQAAIEAIHKHGTAEMQEKYLPKLISGEWTGTMHLTEPQAGTDLSAIRTTAKKEGDHYRLHGQKIFITFGEHDFTENIIHMVLAHIDGLPEGNNGLGLFLVPKFLVNDDGSLGERNDVFAVSVEHKLGIHGSPTCVMTYGDKGGAVGYLVGEEGKGLRNMFTMMNNARIGVGQQGVALCERATQHAKAYAADRVQGGKIGDKSGNDVTIINHVDVRRMLATMRALTEAGRAMALYAGGYIDRATRAADAEQKQSLSARVDLMTPLIKAWCTDAAVEVSSLGVQIHGGMGFIEEAGAAQFYRDARILPIYEGTNGIQSNDLVFRKILRDGGREFTRFAADIATDIDDLRSRNDEALSVIARQMDTALEKLKTSTEWILQNGAENTDAVAAAAVPYLRQCATVAGGYMMAKMAGTAHQLLQAGADNDNTAFLQTKIIHARFFAESLLPQVGGLTDVVTGGHPALLKTSDAQL